MPIRSHILIIGQLVTAMEASEPAVIQVTGTGPFGVQYINPADDPSKSHS